MSYMLSPPRNWGLSQSLQTFSEYRKSERSQRNFCGTTTTGELQEYETLALRLQPPVVEVSNDGPSGRTILTISSANRSGTLVEVVQGLTELGLEVHSARISSDGGWFVDVFEITEADGRKVVEPLKLQYIQSMLNVHAQEETIPNKSGDQTDASMETTVFELAGQDRAGLLADITDHMAANSCLVRSAAVWTYAGRVAFVVSVTERHPDTEQHTTIHEKKLKLLEKLLLQKMNADGKGIVRISTNQGEVHHDRRLHQLMLMEATRNYKEPAMERKASEPVPVVHRDDCRTGGAEVRCVASSPTDSVSSLHDSLNQDYRSPKHSTPMVRIQRCSDRPYWLVNVECKDRNKLLFDTVCTLADMNYDVYHASIDSEKGQALQEYYIRARNGCAEWSDEKADKLRVMLEAAIQRRFPQGLKVHVRSMHSGECLTELAQRLRAANLSITRAKVRPYSKVSGQTLYLMGIDGQPPDPAIVEEACCNLGGVLVDRASGGSEPQPYNSADHKFSFSFLERKWGKEWGMGGRSGSICSSCGSQ